MSYAVECQTNVKQRRVKKGPAVDTFDSFSELSDTSTETLGNSIGTAAEQLSQKLAEGKSNKYNTLEGEYSPKHEKMIRAGALGGNDNVGYIHQHPSSTKKQPSTRYQICNSLLEIVLRISLFVIFIKLERSEAFKRVIQPEEWWMYKNPPTVDYVPAAILLPATFILPFFVVLTNFLLTRDRYDFGQANNVVTLAIALNGVVTSLLKITVGRPRPDFYYRCFPDGVANPEMKCTGPDRLVNEGRKSFPSGHSSFAFTAFGFIFFYISAKLHVFSEKGRGQTWKFCLAIFPLFVAGLIAVSRTCDYHHHWQDVTIGSIIGLSITYVCYRQYYPSIVSSNSHKPYSKKRIITTNANFITSATSPMNGSTTNTLPADGSFPDHSSVLDVDERQALMEEDKDNKWI